VNFLVIFARNLRYFRIKGNEQTEFALDLRRFDLSLTEATAPA